MIKSIKKNFFLYLLFFTPFLIIPGIAVLEFSILLLTIYFFYKNRNFDYYKNKIFLFLLLFSVYVAINAFFQISDNLRFSSFFFFRFSLLSLSIFFILQFYENTPNKEKKNILYFFVIVSLFIFFDSYLQFLSGKNILGFELIRSTVSSIFGLELILGAFMLKLLPILLFLFFYSDVDIKKNYFALIIFFSLYFSVIFIAGGRTPFFLMLIFVFFVILFVKDFRTILSMSTIILILFIFSTFVFDFGKSNPSNRMFIKTFNQITSNFFLKEKNRSQKDKINNDQIVKNITIFSSNHNGHYILAYDLFKKNPIFGLGPKGFRHYCRGVDYDPPIGVCSTHPHNFLIQILSETGLVGLIFYSSGLIFVILKIFRAYFRKDMTKEKNCFLIISIGLIINFSPFTPNGNFFNNLISITSFYYLGIYLYLYKRVFNNL